MQILTSKMKAEGRAAPTCRHLLCFVAAYLLAAALGQWLQATHVNFPIWWPQSGLCVAVLLASDVRNWPRFAATLFCGALVTHWWLYNATFPAGLAISLGQTLAALACCGLVGRWCGSPFRLQSQRDVLGLTFASLLSSVISATVGAATLALSGAQAVQDTWLWWWLGDVAGILAIGPLMLVLLQDWRALHSKGIALWVEASALLILVITAVPFVFNGHWLLTPIIMLLLLWAGLRFGLPGMVATGLALSVIAVRYTAAWPAGLAGTVADLSTRILQAQSLLGIAGISSVILIALHNQHRVARQSVQQAHLAPNTHPAQDTAALRQHGLRGDNEELHRISALQDSLLEAERARIAREIHDDLGASITGVTMHIRMALSAGAAALPQPRERLEEALQLVDAANQSMHRIISDLRPSVLDHLGIWGGIEWLANQWQARTGLPCEFLLDPALTEIIIEGERATALFRIVQESLTNVARHAKATRVDILTQLDGDTVRVTIQDDGKGIAVNPVPGIQSMGLLNMHERARRFGGTLAVKSAPGGGTQVALRLPLGE